MVENATSAQSEPAQEVFQRPPIGAPSRACDECKRKKTKCDMIRPRCSLCQRRNKDCIYPTKRKCLPPRPAGGEKNRGSRYAVKALDEKLDRLMQLVTRGNSLHDATENSSLGSPCQSEASAHSSQDEMNAIHVQIPQAERGPIMESLSYQVPASQQFGSFDNLTDQQDPQWGMFDDFDPVFMQRMDLVVPEDLANSDHTLKLQPFMVESQEDFGNQNQKPNKIVNIPPNHLPIVPIQSPPMIVEPAPESCQNSPTATNNRNTGRFSIPCSPDLLVHLVDLFFTKIHGIIPIFNREEFVSRHIPRGPQGQPYFENLSFESMFLLNGMASLSARFSDHSDLAGVQASMKGEEFAKQARLVYEASTHDSQHLTSTLTYLHGCILLSFYQLTSGPCSFGWILTGVCIRLAYDLGLDLTDEDSREEEAQWSSTEDWVRREELRRAWWSVWELDGYASTLSGRPYAIDQTQMHVLLPAPDENWFSKTPIRSVFIGSDPMTAWQCLQHSPNQDERAWFIVAEILLIQAHALWRRRNVPARAKEDMGFALSCFGLILPQKFHLSSGSIVFDEDNFQKSNWIILTNIILQSAHIITALIDENRSSQNISGRRCSFASDQTPPSISTEEQESRVQNCRQYTVDVCRSIKAWAPQYIPLASPFIVTSLVGPAAIHFGRGNETKGGRMKMEQAMLELSIAHFAKFWNMGSLMLDLVQALKAPIFELPSFSDANWGDMTRRMGTILP